jgi:hypothetical protein
VSAGEIFAVFASGAAVATSIGSLAVALAALLRDRAHLKVETSFAILAPSFEEVIQINVINDGRHTEIVTSVGFQTSDHKQVLFIRPENFPNGQLPWRLRPNESNMAMVPQDVLRHNWGEDHLAEMAYAFARTQSGRLYRDRPSRSVANFVMGRNG